MNGYQYPDYYTIKVWMTNGEVTETRRITQAGMTEYVGQFLPLGQDYIDGVEKVLVFEGDAE